MTAPQRTALLPQGRVHFVGVGGIHMSALAGLVLDAGGQVSGSDLTPSPLTDALAARGATIHAGHDAAYVANAALLVRTVAVPDDNPEIQAAARAGIETISRAQMVARLVAGRRVLAIAGSHGKTTVSTMLTLILRAGGGEPGYILGGESADLPSHAAWGRGAMVLEADEYGRAFHHYAPAVAVITNIDADHLDYYGDAHALVDAFLTYALTLQDGGRLIVGEESPCAMRIAEQVRAQRPDLRIETFALDEAARADLTLQVPGDHNRRNALAALAAAAEEDVSPADARRALAAFRGVRRRFELLGEAAGVTIINDYAHHPKEIEATIAALGERFPGRRSVLLFQPHTYSRSAYLLEGFRTAFQGVDRLLLTETYAAREAPDAGIDAAELAAQIVRPVAEYVGDLNAAADAADAALRDGDVFVAMGAGSIEQAGPALLERLRAR
ncbi:MAG: UDP-N-acetylmuramate--alanine ligase [Chloroflexi bacterium]|nr:MAG: UDP-N-acetylmuramate--alanine ligase [Chloroflexota bacterium]